MGRRATRCRFRFACRRGAARAGHQRGARQHRARRPRPDGARGAARHGARADAAAGPRRPARDTATRRRPSWMPPRFRPALGRAPLTQGFELAATCCVPRDDETWCSAAAGRARSARRAAAGHPLVGDARHGGRATGRRGATCSPARTARADFVVEMENDGTALLRFGDDAHGERPNARHRVRGDLPRRQRQRRQRRRRLDRPRRQRVRRVRRGANPLPAAGGIEPEDVEAARRDAPEAFRTQERAVTAADYAAAAERRADVQRAAATFRWTGSWHTVFVTRRPLRRRRSMRRSRRACAATSSASAWRATTSRWMRRATFRSTSRCTSACCDDYFRATCCARCARARRRGCCPTGGSRRSIRTASRSASRST